MREQGAGDRGQETGDREQGAGGESQISAVLRALDKLAKIGPERVAKEMQTLARATPEQAAELLRFAQRTGDDQDLLDEVRSAVAGSAIGEAGAASLAGLFKGVGNAGVTAGRVQLDLSIARGLDYYTSTVLETTLDDLPDIGSVASGGRYDNLAALYTRQELPGIGASLGLDRLLAAMEELDLVAKTRTTAEVLIPYFDRDRLGDYLRIAAQLRAAGLLVEVFPDPKKLGQQLKYADRRGHRIALIAGAREFDAGECQLKDLATGESRTVPMKDEMAHVIAQVHRVLQTKRVV